MKSMKKSRFAKLLKRLFGDDRGAVMMEYVIVAVLIAAAAVAAVAMFGRTIVGMFGAAAKGATGDETGTQSAQAATRDDQSANVKKAGAYHDSLHTGEGFQKKADQ